MKSFAYIAVLISFMGCKSRGENKEASFSTVDSNTVGTTDTTPSILYLDNAGLDSFPVAMDSVGPTIEPKDTLYTTTESK